ncbi:MAG: peptidoglycan editing factor PgeF [Candidatus Latescibacter sp.]|nr:peptidoglycan editing factor PgeF [Candidatus Latescibacter sp.]
MNTLSPITPDIIPHQIALSGFTTRQGGVSRHPFDSLNLGLSASDDPAAVRENYSRLYRHLGIDGTNTALMRQIHDAAVIKVSKGGMYDAVDGLVTDTPGLLLGVKVADCAPVLLLDPFSRAAGVIHCGWRSLVSGILENTLSLMKLEWNTDPAEVIFTLGPSAGPCCYQVGEEVAARMAPSSIKNRNGKLYADLHEEIIHRLIYNGARRTNVESIPDCTICNNSLYFSHRRDGVNSGRMMGYIMLKDL